MRAEPRLHMVEARLSSSLLACESASASSSSDTALSASPWALRDNKSKHTHAHATTALLASRWLCPRCGSSVMKRARPTGRRACAPVHSAPVEAPQAAQAVNLEALQPVLLGVRRALLKRALRLLRGRQPVVRVAQPLVRLAHHALVAALRRHLLRGHVANDQGRCVSPGLCTARLLLLLSVAQPLFLQVAGSARPPRPPAHTRPHPP